MNKDFNVSLKTLLENRLSFEAYFILWCVRNRDKKRLTEYVTKCGRIEDKHFESLEKEDLLYINKNSKISGTIVFENLILTPKGQELFKIDVAELLFVEFRKHYPSFVKRGGARRPLHTDLSRCKKLYSKIVGADIDKHNLMCQAAQQYYREKDKAGDAWYMQAMPAWLEQENYQIYIDEIKKGETFEEDEKTNVDRI